MANGEPVFTDLEGQAGGKMSGRAAFDRLSVNGHFSVRWGGSDEEDAIGRGLVIGRWVGDVQRLLRHH